MDDAAPTPTHQGGPSLASPSARVGDYGVRCPDGYVSPASRFTPNSLQAALHRLAGAERWHFCDGHVVVRWDGTDWLPVEVKPTDYATGGLYLPRGRGG